MERRNPGSLLSKSFFRRPADEVARDLLGRWLEVRGRTGTVRRLRLVETEAYLGARDPASHARGGLRTPRNESMYLPGGHAYVYFVYGMHFCLNVVTGDAGEAQAVLLRAGEPLAGVPSMRRARARGAKDEGPGDLAGGPARLCAAMGIDRRFDGVPLWGPRRSASSPWLSLRWGEPVPDARVVLGPRVGIGYAGEARGWPLRFALAGNAHVSRPWLWD